MCYPWENWVNSHGNHFHQTFQNKVLYQPHTYLEAYPSRVLSFRFQPFEHERFAEAGRWWWWWPCLWLIPTISSLLFFTGPCKAGPSLLLIEGDYFLFDPFYLQLKLWELQVNIFAPELLLDCCSLLPLSLQILFFQLKAVWCTRFLVKIYTMDIA